MPVRALAIPCLRLPLVYALAVAFVFAAVSLAAAAQFTGSPDVVTATGAVVLTFAFLAFYAWVNVVVVAAGGKALPRLGRPLLR